MTPFEEGQRAAWHRIPITSNPYRKGWLRLADPILPQRMTWADEWEDGWRVGNQERYDEAYEKHRADARGLS